jgi:hypothetical protein
MAISRKLEEGFSMKRRVSLTIAAFVVVSLLGGTMAFAQNFTADVAFPFIAAGKDMAAGKYTIETTAGGPVVLVSPGGLRTLMPVITTLARIAAEAGPRLVFDKVGTESRLSEVWMPGKDGLLLVATTEPHVHAVVAAPPKK